MLKTTATKLAPSAARRLQLAEAHVEAAVAGQRDDAALRPGAELRADAARHAVADRGEAAVGQEVAPGRLGVEHQPAPVRGEAAVGDDDAVGRHRPR